MDGIQFFLIILGRSLERDSHELQLYMIRSIWWERKRTGEARMALRKGLLREGALLWLSLVR